MEEVIPGMCYDYDAACSNSELIRSDFIWGCPVAVVDDNLSCVATHARARWEYKASKLMTVMFGVTCALLKALLICASI